jgi:hypothetical protein
MNELLNQLKSYLKNTDRSVIEEEWKALGEIYGDIGPKVSEYLIFLEEKSSYSTILIETPKYNSEFFYLCD